MALTTGGGGVEFVDLAAEVSDLLNVKTFNGAGLAGSGQHAELSALIAELDADPRPGIVRLTGDVLCQAPVKAKGTKANSVTMYLAEGSRLVRGYASNGAPANAMIQNDTWGTPVQGFSIIGPGEITAVDHTMTGTVIAIDGPNLQLRDFEITKWAGGRAVATWGDHHRYFNVRATGSTGLFGDGGIRFGGGIDMRAEHCYVESGDDTYQLVPTEISAQPSLYDRSIINSWYVNCGGKSISARFKAAVLGTSTAAPMTASIINSGWQNTNGEGGLNRDVAIFNWCSTGLIDVRSIDSSVIPNPANKQGQHISVVAHPERLANVGPVKATFEGYTLREPKRNAVFTKGGVEVIFIRCDFGAPQSTTVTDATLVNGSTSLTSEQAAFDDSAINARLSGTGIPANTLILSVTAGVATMSNPATASGTNVTVAIGGTSTMNLSGTRRAVLEHTNVQGGGNGHTIQAGIPDVTVSGGAAPIPGSSHQFHLTGGEIYDIPDGWHGVNLGNGNGAWLEDTTYTPKAGATNAKAVRVASTRSRATIKGNDMTAIAALNGGANVPITDLAADTIKRDNWGVPDPPPTDVRTIVVAADDTPGSVSSSNSDWRTAPFLQADGTQLILPANTEWGFASDDVFYDASQAGDLAMIFAGVPASTSGRWSIDGLQAGTASSVATIVRTTAVLGISLSAGGVGVGTIVAAKPSGYIKVGADPMTVVIQYRQLATDAANATVIRAFSSIRFNRRR